MTLMLVQMTIARREVNRTNQVQTKINSERSSNFYYTLNPWQHKSLNIKSNEIFFKKSFGRNIAEAGIRGCFL